MCGISGYVGYKNFDTTLTKSLNNIQHRGPDGSGVLSFAIPDVGFVGLGHVRLSILELSNLGAQPMISSDQQVIMIFNGEIYNYKELKTRLIDQCFKGESDSEVLIEYFRRFGVEGFADLRGMFAVAFYEVAINRLTLLRDQIGVKPLYYKQTPEGIFFSSEIRGIQPFMGGDFQIDKNDLYEFLSCGFVYEPKTGLEGVLKIPAGHYAIVEPGLISVQRYFSFEEATRRGTYSTSLLQNAISQQLASDVNLGVFFSGGVDSSVIASVARKPCLFASYFNSNQRLILNNADEFYVRRVADELDVQLHRTDMSDDKSEVEDILNSMRCVAEGTEELVSDYTFYASAELSRVARDQGFKVMLSGLGGDEAFIGYPRYKILTSPFIFYVFYLLLRLSGLRFILRRVPAFAKKIERFYSYFTESSFAIKYARLVGYFSTRELIGLLGREEYARSSAVFIERTNFLLRGFEASSNLVRALVLDFYGFLSHNLTVADKSSMSVGLELRVPLLSQDLYCGYIGGLRRGELTPEYDKLPLKEFLSKKLSRELINRPKTGFNPPLDKKIDLLGEACILGILENGHVSSLLNAKVIRRLVINHFLRSENNSYKIWQLIYLEFWLEKYNIADKPLVAE